MLKQARRLRKLGLAIMWLRPKSKAPFEDGWAKSPVKSWKELEDGYRYGYNVGVRLGAASKFEDGSYLAVVDCDVKSEDPKHTREMERKLSELGTFSGAPEVSSGRGNGSRHIYIRTKTPASPYRFAQSAEKVRVHMPSVKPSKFEERELSDADRNNGVRLRAAWEISVMGEGQQVVLPPSVHPDTGATYEWARPFNKFKTLPMVKLKEMGPRAVEDATKGGEDIVFEDVDLTFSELPPATVDLITSGEGCSDRSAALFGAAAAMVKAGFSDNAILSVLTDRTNYLGDTAFEHSNTTSRKRAASWVRRYTLNKVKAEVKAERAFGEMVEETPLSEDASAEQITKLLKSKDWRTKIERTSENENARPRSILKNVILVMCGEAGADIFERDDFAGIESYTKAAPWGFSKAGQEIRDIDIVHIKVWLSENYRFEPPSSMILEAMLRIAASNSHHPVKRYLQGIEWDGVERVDNWLETYLGARGKRSYLQAVGRKTLCAMIARIMQPGVKFDHVLVLEGPQGCGKSTAVRTLSEPWFTDAMINIGDKDAVLSMRSAWVMELGELSSMRKADIDQLKQFVSQSTDRIRVPYGKLTESFPRQCIFIGTTNSSEYLKDTTGNRRFWPVTVTQLDHAALKKDRDQLLAEARFAWDLGEPLYLEDSNVENIARGEQEQRVLIDEWTGMLESFFEKESENFPIAKFTISDLFGDFGPFPGRPATPSDQMRVANGLRMLGFEKLRMRGKGSRRVFWVKR